MVTQQYPSTVELQFDNTLGHPLKQQSDLLKGIITPRKTGNKFSSSS